MPKHLGDLEQLLLLAIIRLGEDAYGVGIRREILEKTGRSVSAGGIYTVLARLEERGLVSSSLAESTHARGGRRRKLYRATAEGRETMRRALDALSRLADGVSFHPEVG